MSRNTTRRTRTWIAAAALIAPGAIMFNAATAEAAVACVASGAPNSFTCVGSLGQNLTVPAGVTSVEIIAIGASGGSVGNQLGGRGAVVRCVQAVQPGSAFVFAPGSSAIGTAGGTGAALAGGAGTTTAAGGGAASIVAFSLSGAGTPGALLIAGGGGGATTVNAGGNAVTGQTATPATDGESAGGLNRGGGGGGVGRGAAGTSDGAAGQGGGSLQICDGPSSSITLSPSNSTGSIIVNYTVGGGNAGGGSTGEPDFCQANGPVPAGFQLWEGTPNADVFTGTSDNDLIRGLGGNDVFEGSSGNDIICGGAGDDTLAGGSGNDKGFGGTGVDTWDGGSGNDTFLQD